MEVLRKENEKILQENEKVLQADVEKKRLMTEEQLEELKAKFMMLRRRVKKPQIPRIVSGKRDMLVLRSGHKKGCSRFRYLKWTNCRPSTMPT